MCDSSENHVSKQETECRMNQKWSLAPNIQWTLQFGPSRITSVSNGGSAGLKFSFSSV